MLSVSGCFSTREEILKEEASTWDMREAMTILASEMSHNLMKESDNILAIVTPFSPNVVTALIRMQQVKKHWNKDENKVHLDRLLKDATGLYVDTAGTLWTSTGNRVRGMHDVDSMLFYVSLINRTWPCQPPMFNGIPLIALADVPCDLPDISDLEFRIVLENTEGIQKSPKYVAGKKNSILMEQEWLFILFDFTDDKDFLKSGITFKIMGFDNRLSFDVVDSQYALIKP